MKRARPSPTCQLTETRYHGKNSTGRMEGPRTAARQERWTRRGGRPRPRAAIQEIGANRWTSWAIAMPPQVKPTVGTRNQYRMPYSYFHGDNAPRASERLTYRLAKPRDNKTCIAFQDVSKILWRQGGWDERPGKLR